MTQGEEAAAAVKLMEQLSDVFGEAVAGVLQGSAAAIKQFSNTPDQIVFAAIVNGGLIGILTYMGKLASEGRLRDPDGDLTRLFHLAGNVWDGVRSGESDGKVTLQ